MSVLLSTQAATNQATEQLNDNIFTATLVEPPARSTRAIEFLGDSITAGFCNECMCSKLFKATLCMYIQRSSYASYYVFDQHNMCQHFLFAEGHMGSSLSNDHREAFSGSWAVQSAELLDAEASASQCASQNIINAHHTTEFLM